MCREVWWFLEHPDWLMYSTEAWSSLVRTAGIVWIAVCVTVVAARVCRLDVTLRQIKWRL